MRRSAFTLMEMLVVVLIISAVYGFTVNSLESVAERAERVTLENLPEMLQRAYAGKAVSVICTAECRECGLYVDGTFKEQLENFLDDSVEVNTYDHRYGSRGITFAPLFDENGVETPVCFRYDMDAHGIGPSMIVTRGETTVVYGSYLSKSTRYASLEAAVAEQQAVARRALQ
jgi:prepilin-type N-terminal cleavage/methylation domain-containing protein